MAAPKGKIELLPQEEWETTFFGKVLKWLLTVGRYIVILTELIVILAFLSRFKLDHDLTNLNEDIGQKQAVIQSLADFEADFLFFQKQLLGTKDLRDEQLKTSLLLGEISELTPIDIAFSDLNVKDDKANFNAEALSEAGLATFIRNLKRSPHFSNLSIDSLGIDPGKGAGISFSMKTEISN